MGRRSSPKLRIFALAIVAMALVATGVLLYRHHFKRHRNIDGREIAGIVRIEFAVGEFASDCGRFPTTAEGLAALITAPPDTSNWRGPYIPRLPHDSWNRVYVYRYPSPKNHDGFLVLSVGPDGIEGTDDVSNDILQEMGEEEGAKVAVARS